MSGAEDSLGNGPGCPEPHGRERDAMVNRAGRLLWRGGVKGPRHWSDGLRQAALTQPNSSMATNLEAAPQNEKS
jgi:hypothetical protein